MAYLTAPEYLARFGERETTLLTNDADPLNGVPATYDADKLETALTDATEEVESYIASRYTVPLASPPTIVKGWVAALARIKLYEGTGRVSDAAKDAADRATRQLEQLVAGRINLPVDEGATPPEAIGGGTPIVSGDRDTPTFGNALDSFTAPFTGGFCVPEWRRGC